MNFKIALKNVKKSYQDYSVYFFTLFLSAFLFYTFNSMDAQKAAVALTNSQRGIFESLGRIMNAFSVVTLALFAFLILYANKYLMKRRKKELGIYSVLGMPKNRIVFLLAVETSIVGVFSLLTGLAAGVLASPVFAWITALVFRAETHVRIVFSSFSALYTVLCFAVIFMVVMISNGYSLKKQSGIQLIQDERKNETVKMQSKFSCTICFLLSGAIFAAIYTMALKYPIEFSVMLLPIGGAALFGTLLFFRCVSLVLLKAVRKNKKIYYRGLNLFSIRQISAKINTNYRSLSFVCVMLTVSICMFALGVNTNIGVNQNAKALAPYDYSFKADGRLIREEISAIPDQRLIQADCFLNVYDSGLSNPDMASYFKGKNEEKALLRSKKKVRVVSLSSLNRLRRMQGLEDVQLEQKEAFLFSNSSAYNNYISAIVKNRNTIKIFSQERTLVQQNPYFSLSTAASGNEGFVLALPDAAIPEDAAVAYGIYNSNLAGETDSRQFEKDFKEGFRRYCHTNHIRYEKAGVYSCTKSSAVDAGISTGAVFTFIGLYLGIVFMIAGAAILALQQLSSAADNRGRYKIISDLGASYSMEKNSVLIQNAVYFLMPLILAVIHSAFGFLLINTLLAQLSAGGIVLSSIITAALFSFVYSLYFIITYRGCCRSIREKR